MPKETSNLYRNIYNLTMAVSALVVLLFIVSCDLSEEYLMLTVTDPRSGTVYHKMEIESNTEFELRYRHSVSGSLVQGTFLVNDRKLIEPISSKYTSFGPGLPLDSGEDYVIEDGKITVYHDEEPRESIRLWVSSYTEETLIIDELEIPLYKPEVSHLLLEIKAVNIE